jgi:hypothetical protein
MTMKKVMLFLAFVAGAHAQCDGPCQQTPDSCSVGYVAGLCQVRSMSRYVCRCGVSCALPDKANHHARYECAEFVARALAAGGYLSGLPGLEAQSKYVHGGKSHDLLWVSSLQGGPLGLRELSLEKGWSGSATSAIVAHSAVIAAGSGGSYGHVAVGVGANLRDAHNNARYHTSSRSSYYTVNQVPNPPGAGECRDNCATYPESNGPHVPRYKRMAALGVNETQCAWA